MENNKTLEYSGKITSAVFDEENNSPSFEELVEKARGSDCYTLFQDMVKDIRREYDEL